jgi:tRNA 2-selenouridine synthase
MPDIQFSVRGYLYHLISYCYNLDYSIKRGTKEMHHFPDTDPETEMHDVVLSPHSGASCNMTHAPAGATCGAKQNAHPLSGHSMNAKSPVSGSGLPQSDDFRAIVVNRTPLIDLRAPVEFGKGAFPHTVNLPLLYDEERHLVGIKYKEEGNSAAVKLGHMLVGGETKERRVKGWLDFLEAHPHAMLYCFRGGQRSQIAQEWLAKTGRETIRLKGGYKAFRHYLMEETERGMASIDPIVLGGRTGSGKTLLLKKMKHAIDLEGLANHRGSSFGRNLSPQPTLINFENALAYALIEHGEQGRRHLVFEDEGRSVGRLYLPQAVAERLSNAPLVVLETPTEERVQITFEEYVLHAHQYYGEHYGTDNYLSIWAQEMEEAMQRIQKRLGGVRYKYVRTLFEAALQQQREKGTLEGYRAWIAYLLHEYYDPMYDYQLEKRRSHILFRGNAEEIEQYLQCS